MLFRLMLKSVLSDPYSSNPDPDPAKKTQSGSRKNLESGSGSETLVAIMLVSLWQVIFLITPAFYSKLLILVRFSTTLHKKTMFL